MRQFKRSRRVGEQLLRDISIAWEAEFMDSAPALITFTRVKLSDDLRHATVFYSCLGSVSDKESVADFFEVSSKRLRKVVGNNMQIRRVPELIFRFDPSIEEGIRIEQLLNEIKTDSNE